jgi:hypothetical protein
MATADIVRILIIGLMLVMAFFAGRAYERIRMIGRLVRAWSFEIGRNLADAKKTEGDGMELMKMAGRMFIYVGALKPKTSRTLVVRLADEVAAQALSKIRKMPGNNSHGDAPPVTEPGHGKEDSGHG